MDVTMIVELLKFLGPFGVVVWIVFWVFVKMIPGILATHAEAMTRVTGDFREALRETREDFKRELSAERDLRVRDLDLERRMADLLSQQRRSLTPIDPAAR